MYNVCFKEILTKYERQILCFRGITPRRNTTFQAHKPVCRKMSQSARKNCRNYAALISSEKSFHDLLGDLPDLNLENTSITQLDLIGVQSLRAEGLSGTSVVAQRAQRGL